MDKILILGSDTKPFLIWWLTSILFGIAFYPLGAVLFRRFDDKGWLFSKTLGIITGGYLVFAAGSFGLLRFNSGTCIALTLAAAGFCWLLFLWKGSEDLRQRPSLKVILQGEFIFFLFFLFWTYCSGFKPEVSGTEKPMDYGFMAAMMRSDVLPAKDIWYSEGVINYYYGGQYLAVYLTKLTFTRINETYHLMRTMVGAFCFALSWSIVRQALRDRGLTSYTANMGGLFAGAAVSLAGNGHYLLYGLFGSVFKLSGWDSYWFPHSTRYIGHNPLVDDQCIHEFPSYSFVLGDLHAHVVNLFLVLTIIGVMYAWFQNLHEENDVSQKSPSLRSRLLKFILQLHVLTAGILTGIFKWTNYWDFIIYYTVFLFSAVCISFRKREKGKKDWILQVLLSMVMVYVLQTILAYPFNKNFVSMFKGIGICVYHTLWYQILVLWGLPILAAILLAVTVVRKDIHPVDVFFVMLSICGLGLILIPELVYVKDIYEEGYARANTMFKLTYQAYVMFGLMMSYTFFRILCLKAKKPVRLITAVCAVLVFLTFGYCGYAINCWFGNILDTSGYKGLDAEAFLEDEYPEDAGAIRYLEDHVEGQPVVLEAPGDSYSENCRVSAMTGLPTIEGWYVHEWLWRDNPDQLNLLKEDIYQIYTNTDADYVKRLLKEYNVSYIFIGSCEWNLYGEELNLELLQSLGRVCYDGVEQGIVNGALIIEVNQTE